MFNQETLDVVTHSAFFDVEAARAQRLSLDQPPQMPIGDAVRVATRETGSGTGAHAQGVLRHALVRSGDR